MKTTTHNSGLAIAAIACAIAGLNAGRAAAEERARPLPEVEWNTSLNHFQVDNETYIGQRISVVCPPRHITGEDEPLYGTGAYPSTSPVCLAALHASAITSDGGAVTVQLNPGLPAYEGTRSNGVQSYDLPGTERSIAFVGLGDDAAADAIQDAYVMRLDWDEKFTRTGLANRELVGQRFAFDCPAAPVDMNTRRVVGTDSYAFDTMICRAAVHAGVISFEGGRVLLQLDPGVRDLPGSRRNGIETQSAGTSGVRSISFVPSP